MNSLPADLVFEFCPRTPLPTRTSRATAYGGEAGTLLQWPADAELPKPIPDGTRFHGRLADVSGAWFEGSEARISACLLEPGADEPDRDELNLLPLAPWACAQRTYRAADAAHRRILIVLHWMPAHLGHIDPDPRIPAQTLQKRGWHVARCMHDLVYLRGGDRVLPIKAET